jgi:hypothetical protein
MGLWNYIRLPTSDGPILVFTACSLRCYTGTIHTIAASPHLSPQALESLLESLLDSLIESLLESLASGGVEFSTGSFWPMANSEFVEALANGRL